MAIIKPIPKIKLLPSASDIISHIGRDIINNQQITFFKVFIVETPVK